VQAGGKIVMGIMKDILTILPRNCSIPQKINYCKYLFSKKGETLSYWPLTLSIVATDQCTLHCDMCPTHSKIIPKSYEHTQRGGKDMGIEMFKRIIDRYYMAMNVQIIGSGEPLLNKDFFAMVDYAAGKKMIVKTFSNGTTVARNIDRILNSKLDGITISLNGHNAQEYNRMTGMPEDVYREIYDAIKHLAEERDKRRSGIKIKVSHIIDKHNYAHIPEMIRISLDLGVDHTFFCNFLACPYDGFRAEERALEAEGVVVERTQGFINAIPARQRKKFDFPVLIDRHAAAFQCNSHFSQIRFDGSGDVSSCSMMLLNMRDKGKYPDADVWNGEFFRTMRRNFLSGDSKRLYEQCLWCPDNVGIYPWK
jgi:MoaA/NifB/PqqE/SkfB family radical SAM enzyme